MQDLQILKICDHNVPEREVLLGEGTIRRGYKSNGDLISIARKDFIDVFPNIFFIDSIIRDDNVVISPEMYSYFYDGTLFWTKDYDAGARGKYKIPNIGDYYTVKVKYMDAVLHQYSKDKCTRCNGWGWYLSPLEEGKDLVPTSGPMRVAQDFLKALLTIPGTDFLNPFYGAGLLTDGNVAYLNDELETNISTAVLNAETTCKGITDIRSSDELLSSALIEEITMDYENSGVYVVIRLLTIAGAEVRFSLNL